MEHQGHRRVVTCHGNSPDSPCCGVPGHPGGMCKFLVDVPGRAKGCGLFVELGSWDAVHADPRYLAEVRPAWDANAPPVPDCGDWRGPGCCYGPDRTPESDAAYERARLRVVAS